ncbi:MAG: leucine-rich repeat protein, partial [Acutalibacteraceae bacterium]
MKKRKLTPSIILSLLISFSFLFICPASAVDTIDIEKMTTERIEQIRNTENTDTSAVTGTVYYVSQTNGDDGNDGKSPSSAWKTLKKVAQYSFSDGDAVLFERGGIYRGHYFTNQSLLFGSYGSGSKPRLYGSVNATESGTWRLAAENIWCYSEDTYYDIGNIVFDADRDNLNAVYGHKVLTDSSTVYDDTNISQLLTEDLQFYSVGFAASFKNTATKLYLYSSVNPNERFSQIELCEDSSIITARRNNTVIDNIEFRYTGAHGVNSGDIDGFTVTNCEFAWIGGGIQSYNNGSPVRFGNAVEVYGTSKNYTVNNNYIWQVYDAGITPQITKDTASVGGPIAFTNNVIEYCNYSVEFWNTSKDPSSVINGFHIENNIMRFAGYGFCTERTDKNGAAHFKSWPNRHQGIYYVNKMTDFVIRNNIFDECDGQMMYLCTDYADSLPIIENNTFIQSQGKGGILVNITGDGNETNRPPYVPSLLGEQYPDNSFSYTGIQNTQSGVLENIRWNLDLTTGHLTLEGSGALPAETEGSAPWYDFAKDIRKVTIDSGITVIGRYAFYDCVNLTELVADENAAFLSGSFDGVNWKYSPETAELNISGAGEVPDFENGTAPWSFLSKAVKTLTVGENITKLGNYAFASMSHLERINFNPSACANLAKDPQDGNNGANYTFAWCGTDSDGITVVFGENVRSVPAHLFRPSAAAADSPKVTSISFAGNACEALGDHCFRTLDDLCEITLPSLLKKIGTFAFGNCSKLVKITVPESVDTLGGYIFMNCTSLEEVTLPSAVTSAYTVNMFGNCKSLKKVNLPDGLKRIDERMFHNCPSLAEITIPETVTAINQYAFNGCKALAELHVPSSVSVIEVSAFAGCSGLSKITVENPECDIKAGSIGSGTTIYGYTGSTAETYANENDCTFVSLEVPHEHIYQCVSHKDASCTEKGFSRYVCEI